MRVLVCGGRDYRKVDVLFAALDRFHADTPITLVIHGAASGADRLAAHWAKSRRVRAIYYRADWQEHGRSAGPIRNQRMVDQARPQYVIAFPGGVGTADMVRRARTADIPVVEIPADYRAERPRTT